ncbi:hypothetical protein ACFLSK_00160 [Chloroflexota bacterium]
MIKQRATALPNSPTPPQLRVTPGSRLTSTSPGLMPSNQGVYLA